MDDILDFWRHAQQAPDDVALIDEKGRRWTAGELLAEANRIANGLQQMEMGPSEVLAVLMPKSAMLLAAYLAATQIGIHFVVLNPRLTAPELQYILADSAARVLLFHPDAVPRATLLAVLRETSAQCVALGQLEDYPRYEDTFGRCPTSLPTRRAAGSLLTYTSGTTGRPKGVLRVTPATTPELIYRPLIEWFMESFNVAPRAGGVHLCACPLHYTGPLLYASYTLHIGHALVLLPAWHPRLALQLIEQYKATTSFMVPYQFVSLLKLPEETRSRFSQRSLQCVVHGSAPCPMDTKRDMLEWWGDKLFESYGSTEVGGTVATPADWRAHPGTVGRATPPNEVRILDDQGNELAPDRPGNVFMRATAANAFVYKNDPEKTRAGRRGDFVSVGDYGYLNDAGYLFLLDRQTDMINCRGEHIYPAEIEAALASHRQVADCGAFGAPHPEWGQQVRLAVQLVPNTLPSADIGAQILAHLRARLAMGKCPREIDFVASLPRDEGGKLRRHELRSRFTDPSPASARSPA